ncbi:MAG: nucleotidyltransferase substrate binding protein [Deltaproteobacteria bacterium]|nr:nucleotidyltransferase substrate binding protein [Deltaproteobacteria bacterium]
MPSNAPKKRHKAIEHLDAALAQYAKESSELNFLTAAKAFEVAVEYEWRDLKRLVEDQGLDAPSPKMAVKLAARLQLIAEPETWMDCIDARNNSVHDYFGISEKEYISLAKTFLRLAHSRTTP